MLEIEEAIQMLKDAVDPIKETEEIPLMEASGRELAEDILADIDQPPFPRSPLDGYAVRGEDTAGASKDQPVELEVIGKIYAGQVFDGSVGKKQCLRLMTGAPIPDGADTVIRQEDTDYGEDYVRIYQELAPWQNYCYTGEDYKKGNLLLEEGTVLSGVTMGVIAGSGRDRVSVYREPVITVISTGDEVICPGDRLAAGKIYDSNRYMVSGRLKDLGLKHFYSEHCPDQVEEMCGRIREAAAHSDLIITTGGVSVGEKDIMHQVLEELHGQKIFWKVRVKPGAPTLAFTVDRTLVICLTGNPYGVAVNFELLVRPVMAELTGNPKWQGKKLPGILKNDSPKRGKMRRFMRGFYSEHTEPLRNRIHDGMLEHNLDGPGTEIPEIPVRIIPGNHASGTLSSMAACNCLVEISGQCGEKEGEKVWIYPL